MTTKRALYRKPVDTAKHHQFKKLCLEYFTNHEKLLKKPSRIYAFRARKAIVQAKRVAHEVGVELLSLYAESLNIGKEQVNKKEKKCQNTKKRTCQKNQAEEHHLKNQAVEDSAST